MGGRPGRPTVHKSQSRTASGFTSTSEYQLLCWASCIGSYLILATILKTRCNFYFIAEGNGSSEDLSSLPKFTQFTNRRCHESENQCIGPLPTLGLTRKIKEHLISTSQPVTTWGWCSSSQKRNLTF